MIDLVQNSTDKFIRLELNIWMINYFEWLRLKNDVTIKSYYRKESFSSFEDSLNYLIGKPDKRKRVISKPLLTIQILKLRTAFTI